MLKKYPVVFLILFLAIGYAGISSVYKINGDIDISYDDTNFSVIFSRASSSYGTVSFNDKNLKFKTIALNSINNSALLEIDIVNISSQYDASINVNCNLLDTNLNEQITLSSDIKNPIKLESNSGVTHHLSINLKRSSTLEISSELTCTLESAPTSRTEAGKTYVESPLDPILNGADPVLDNEGKLIPIKLSLDGAVEYADITKRWYSYKNKEWANAIILVDNPSQNYNVGDKIKEDDIESYFVWVPRFRYQIFNTGSYNSVLSTTLPAISSAQEISIEFENKSTTPSKGSKVEEWLTHPAFINYDTNGIWVGKFETGYKDATSKSDAEQNVNDASKVIIKPNSYSWRNIQVSNSFKSAFNYAPSLLSHMMQNTEWGATAYLSHSKYGINTEVRINNNSELLTGYAGNSKEAEESTINTSQYNTEIGYLASTNGNITGIYDMSGGAWEYVAGYLYGAQGNAGFTGDDSKYEKYLDKYSNNSNRLTFYNRILGDATGEMGPFYKNGNFKNWTMTNWYQDGAFFPDASQRWFVRSGSYEDSVGSGQFTFSCLAGESHNLCGFRITLAPN